MTPVSAPRMKTVACALGSRLSVSSGSAPIAFRPGVSRTTRPCLQKRMRVVDERVAPGGHLDLAFVVARRVVVGRRVVPEAERARLLSVTHSVRVTSCSDCASLSASPMSSARRRQARGWARISPSERPSRRVSIGSSSSDAGSSPRQPSSTGHIVVRPGVAGRMRRPVSAKKIALISSDLPRENSATKATTSFSLPSRSRKAAICSAASPWARSCSSRKRASASARSPSAARQPPRASRLVANEGVIERRRGSSHGSARVHERAVTKRFLTAQVRAFRTPGLGMRCRPSASLADRSRKTSPSPPGRCAASASRSGCTACPRGRRPSHRAGTRPPRRERRGSRARSSRRARRRVPASIAPHRRAAPRARG